MDNYDFSLLEWAGVDLEFSQVISTKHKSTFREKPRAKTTKVKESQGSLFDYVGKESKE